jgi:hypothetical protein
MERFAQLEVRESASRFNGFGERVIGKAPIFESDPDKSPLEQETALPFSVSGYKGDNDILIILFEIMFIYQFADFFHCILPLLNPFKYYIPFRALQTAVLKRRECQSCDAAFNKYRIYVSVTLGDAQCQIELRWTMLSGMPFDLAKLTAATRDKELLRAAIIAELDAINLYEQMAATTKDKNLKIIFMDVAKEEKTHVGEFQALLLKLDKEQVAELASGKEEVDELTS